MEAPNEKALQYESKRVQELIAQDRGTLSELEKQVASAIQDRKMLATEPDDIDPPTFGERLADRVASFGGSWTFILIFTGIIVVWIIANVAFLANKGFDPYPFILLNLCLSCLAALQAPVIMMSQNRQEDRDRKHAEHDYVVNLKAELEIRLLHDKLDHLLLVQMEHLMEIQSMQCDMLGRLTADLEAGEPTL